MSFTENIIDDFKENQRPTTTSIDMERLIWAAAFIETLRYNGGDISWETADNAVTVYRKIKQAKEAQVADDAVKLYQETSNPRR